MAQQIPSPIKKAVANDGALLIKLLQLPIIQKHAAISKELGQLKVGSFVQLKKSVLLIMLSMSKGTNQIHISY